MNLAIIKYNAGNIQSVLYALERIGMQATVTDDPAAILGADKVIFPGVGEASSAMQYLRERGLDQLIRSLQQPVLGICLGMQLMCRYSEENDTPCLGIFEEEVRRFQSPDASFKIPQMGWNTIGNLQSPLFTGVPEASYVYFVHSYYCKPATPALVCTTTDYGQEFCSMIWERNVFAVQFHPEKSQEVGLTMLTNFVKLT